ncbi:hypothetical protein RND71_003515 [Anisodus tanguticus]|uniref:MYB transcription factor n=1 Tax=Anisodus tanguticus TaxID=243964 RepID=A0AAE1SUQ8_9SOLA|nr:hypothetical protein RND71_003515 [Anisodus tanguticus]
MGAPKQKWTPEEEAALKAGIRKYGPGKWRTILKDSEFSGVLYLRSNVDLKDKWRNMNVMANGWGSRDKARLALKRMIQAPVQDESCVAVSSAAESDEEIPEARPATTSSGSPQNGGSRRSLLWLYLFSDSWLLQHHPHAVYLVFQHFEAGRSSSLSLMPEKRMFIISSSTFHLFSQLDNLIMEAISNLKEPGGSNKTTIATYIENDDLLLDLIVLLQMKRKYKMAPKLTSSDRRRNLAVPLLDTSQRTPSKVDGDDINMLTRSQIDLELAKMGSMSPQEAAAAAAQAVAEADAAIAEAEESNREAEAAEADAEAAQAFAEAAMKTLQGRSISRMKSSPWTNLGTIVGLDVEERIQWGTIRCEVAAEACLPALVGNLGGDNRQIQISSVGILERDDIDGK